MLELLPVLGGIVTETLKLLNEKQRTRLMIEYHEILKELADAENKRLPDYTDAALDILRERLCLFLEAFRGELKKANVEILSQKS